MKNFSDLLATDFNLDVCVNDTTVKLLLKSRLTFNVDDRVTVDGIEVLPKYAHLAQHGQLEIRIPFYQWYHQVSAQGWLLTPQLARS